MTLNSSNASRWLNRALIAGVCINTALMLYYVFVSYRHGFTSDAAAANLLAQEIYESGNFFPRDWHFVNGDLWVVFMHAWTVPFLAVMKNGFAAHALAGTIGCALVLAGTWCITAVMQLSLRTRWFALLLVSSGLSPNFSENIYGQQAYGALYFMACFILYTAWRFLQAQPDKQSAWAVANVVLVTVVTLSNPQRAVVYYLLPTLVGAFALALLPHAAGSTAPTARVRLGMLAGLTLVAAVAGAVLHGYFLALGHSSPLPMPVVWLGFDAMATNALGAIRGLVSLLAGWPQPGLPIASASSAIGALRLLAALAVLFLAPWVVLRFLITGHPGRQFVAAAGATSLAVTLFVFVTSTLAPSSDPESSIRYVVPGLVIVLLVLVGVVAEERGAAPVRRLAGALALAILALSAPIAYELNRPVAMVAGASPIVGDRLARFLKNAGLHYGYATFWHAGRTTVLSDGAVKVRQVHLNGGALMPHLHLAAEHWYAPGAWQGPTFLLVTPDEAKTIDWNRLFKTTGQPQRQLAFEGHTVVVFDHNIARDYPHWTVALKETLRYVASADTPHNIGTYTDHPPALTARKGEAGALRYGPYQRLAAGRYRIRFDVRTEGEGVSDFGTIDVVTTGGKVLASAHLTAAGAQHVNLSFSAREMLRDVEFRVFSSGNGSITFHQAELSNEQSH
jgi:hypothetical protein